MPNTAPCRCWVSYPRIPHGDHCCFVQEATPLDGAPRQPMCEHWHPEVPRPPKLSEGQARAWIRRICVECQDKPASAGRYCCDECHRGDGRATA